MIVGGGNSAGQAALHMAEHAQAVTVVVRHQASAEGCRTTSSSGSTSIPGSRFERRLRSPKLEVTPTCGASLSGERRDETEELAADAMFLLIGAQPVTAGVEGWLRRDEHGFLLTGQDVVADAPRELVEAQPGSLPLGIEPTRRVRRRRPPARLHKARRIRRRRGRHGRVAHPPLSRSQERGVGRARAQERRNPPNRAGSGACAGEDLNLHDPIGSQGPQDRAHGQGGSDTA